MRRKLLATLAFLILSRVSPATAAPPPELHRTFVDVSINQEPRGKAMAAFDDTADVYLTQADLQRYGIPVDGAPCVTIAETCFVDLLVLKPKIAFTFDRTTLALSIVLGAALLPKKSVQLAYVPTLTDNYVRGNVLNYSINALGNGPVAGVLDDRFGIDKNEVLQGGVGQTTTGLIQRTYTNFVLDAPSVQRRTTFGDAEANGGDLGGTFDFGGILVERQFSLDPYSITYPTPTLQTAITQPSQAQIFVNGVLVKTLDLPPGYYTLSNIPVIAGYSNAQVVIRNAFGQSTFNTGTFGGVSLLRKGLTDYQYGIGFLRENIGLPTDTYGPAVVTAGYRLGISDQATIGGLIQSSSGLQNAGVDYDAQIGAGVLHTGAGSSFGTGRDGVTGAIAYTSTTPQTGIAIALQAQSRDYTRISSFGPIVQTTGNALVSYSRQISQSASIGISEQITKYLGDGTFGQTIATLSQRLGPWNLSASYDIDTSPRAPGVAGGATRSFSIQLMRNLQSPPNTSVTESVNLQTGPGAASGYELTSSALSPLVSSYTAVVQSKPGGGFGIGGDANLASPYGTLQLFLSPGSTISTIGASLDGAVVSTPKGTFFTQAVQDAYALVDTGVPGAAVYLSGQYVGTTSGNGAMVVPFLQSHFDNSINVSNRGLAVTEVLQGEGSVDTAPGYHNGTFVGTPVERVHAVVGKLLLRSAGIDVIPMYGDAQLVLTNSTTPHVSPIDDTGRVYFQGAAAGSYRLTISVAGKTCATTVDVPEFAGPTYDLGTVRCAL